MYSISLFDAHDSLLKALEINNSTEFAGYYGNSTAQSVSGDS